MTLKKNTPEISIRPADKAGSWYKASASNLSSDFETWLNNANQNQNQNQNQVEIKNESVKAIICPHAGYSHCGPTAAYSYQHVNIKSRRIFIFGPDHKGACRKYNQGSHSEQPPVALLSGVDLWQTPFGNVQVSTETIQQLLQTQQFLSLKLAEERKEHCLEMIVPFLAYMFKRHQQQQQANKSKSKSKQQNNEQKLQEEQEQQQSFLESFEIVPVILSRCTPQQHSMYAKIFLDYFQAADTFFVISSDFSHWGNKFRYTPFDNSKFKTTEIFKYIREADHKAMKHMTDLDYASLLSYVDETGIKICGRHSILLLLKIIQLQQQQQLAKNKAKAKAKGNASSSRLYELRFIDYSQSKQVHSMNEHSVSYAAGVLIQT